MAERNPIPTESDALNWNSDGVTYPSTDPGAPKRLTGFQPINTPVPAPGEIIPANDHNWLWKKCMEFLTWNKEGTTRQWRDLYEGIAAGSINDVFRVVPPLGTPSVMYARLTEKWNVASSAATVGDPNQISIDGEQIYYLAGAVNQSLIAAEPADGSEIWETSAGITQFATLTTDGAAVYITSTNAGEPGLHVRDRTDGSSSAVGGAEYGGTKLVCNGVYAVLINGTVGGANSVTFWTTATPAELGTVAPAGAIVALAIDADQAYIGGTRNGGFDVRALTLATRATAWSAALDANDPSPVNAIAADGDCVYVACDSFAIAAGGNRSLFCLERVSGTVLWSIDLADLDYLAVDDRYLYAVTSAGLLNMISLRGSVPAVVATLADVIDPACDGISVVCRDLTTTTNFQRNMTGGAAKEFMIAEGSDVNRRPFFNLAVPVDSGI